MDFIDDLDVSIIANILVNQGSRRLPKRSARLRRCIPMHLGM